MDVILQFGIPYRDLMKNDCFHITAENGSKIEALMRDFLIDHSAFKEQVIEKGYYKDGHLKAIYVKNGKIALYNEQVNHGDTIRIMFPIVGG